MQMLSRPTPIHQTLPGANTVPGDFAHPEEHRTGVFEALLRNQHVQLEGSTNTVPSFPPDAPAFDAEGPRLPLIAGPGKNLPVAGKEGTSSEEADGPAIIAQETLPFALPSATIATRPLDLGGLSGSDHEESASRHDEDRQAPGNEAIRASWNFAAASAPQKLAPADHASPQSPVVAPTAKPVVILPALIAPSALTSETYQGGVSRTDQQPAVAALVQPSLVTVTIAAALPADEPADIKPVMPTARLDTMDFAVATGPDDRSSRVKQDAPTNALQPASSQIAPRLGAADASTGDTADHRDQGKQEPRQNSIEVAASSARITTPIDVFPASSVLLSKLESAGQIGGQKIAPITPVAFLDRAEAIAGVVDRLVATREAGIGPLASVAIAHREFGEITVNFATNDHALDVSLVAEDQDKQRALSAALHSADRVPSRETSSSASQPSHQAGTLAHHERGSDANLSRDGGSGQTREQAPGKSQGSKHSHPEPIDPPTHETGGIYV